MNRNGFHIGMNPSQFGGLGFDADQFFDDLIINQPSGRNTRWEQTLGHELAIRNRYGNDSLKMSRYIEYEEDTDLDEESPEPEDLEFEEGKTYAKWELEQIADNLLRQDTRRELCRRCGKYGEETGHIESQPQFKPDGAPLVDDTGSQLYVDFPEIECEEGHRWYKGEGKARGNGGQNPILFEEHLRNRQKREIYCAVGTPDPEIVSGIYNRVHPQGRRVNSPEQRRKHGASFYR